MIEVFKTNVQNREQSDMILDELCDRFPEVRVNFDLDDVDNILRIESQNIDAFEIEKYLALLGFECKVLEDVIP